MDARTEVPRARHPKDRHKLDLIVPIAALFVSFLSILIAWYSATVEKQMAGDNERMVQASSLPHVSQTINTINRSSGLNHVTFSVANEGVGPAEIRSAALSVRGSPVRGPAELLSRYGIPGGHLEIASLTNVMLRPGQELDYFDLDADPSIAAQVTRMIGDIEGHRIAVHICYCSVFDECWTVDAPNQRPKRVRQCPIVQVPYE